MYKTIDFC